MNTRQLRTLERLRTLAEERGGKCLSDRYLNAKSELEWECAKGHRWRTLAKTVRSGTWCPTCKRRRFRFTIKDMRALAAERGGQCLSEAYLGNLKKLRWRCEAGHEFETTPNTVKGGSWCKRCSMGMAGIEDMRRVAKERGGRLLSKTYVNSTTPLRWRCREGHEWDAPSKNVYSRNTWCPYCAGSRASIERLHELAEARDGKCLAKVYSGFSVPVPWRCKNGHVFEKTPQQIATGSWCSTCSPNRKLTIEAMQELAARRGGECLSKRYVAANKTLRWRCAKGHEWKATPSHVRSSGSWCPECAGPNRGSAKRLRELASANDGRCLAKKWPGTRTEVSWRCKKGHTFKLTPLQVEAGVWCSDCGPGAFSRAELRHIVKTRGGTLLTRGLKKSANLGITPLDIRCKNGHEFQTSAAYVRRGHWCRYCAKRTRSIKWLQNLARERGGKSLARKYETGDRVYPFRCAKGHKFSARPIVIEQGGWCPLCEREQEEQ